VSHPTYAWWLLGLSIVAEVAGTLALRHAHGFTRVWPSLIVAACYGGAIWLMARAVRHLEVGLAYAVWAGAGTALTAMLGMLLFGESAGALRLAGLGCIVVGVVLLNLSA